MYLNCHSWFSFKYGTLSPEALLREAEKNNVHTLALTDINNTSGILDFIRRCKGRGIKPIAGIDYRAKSQQQFIGLARNNEGFRELNDFLSTYIENGEDIPPVAPAFDNCYIIYPFNHPYSALKENEFVGIKPSDLGRLNFSAWKNVPHKLVIHAPVTIRSKIDFNAHRLLQAIANNTLLSKLPFTGQAMPDEIMIQENSLLKIYEAHRHIICNTKKITDDCSIDFEFGKSKNKKSYTGSLNDDELLLNKICEENLSYRYPQANEKIYERLKREIKTITEQGFSSYFLINWEIVS
jgi:DNA polymerase III alpha subunit